MKKFALLMCPSVSCFLLDVFSDVFEFAIFTLYSDVYVCGETFFLVGPLVLVSHKWRWRCLFVWINGFLHSME